MMDYSKSPQEVLAGLFTKQAVDDKLTLLDTTSAELFKSKQADWADKKNFIDQVRESLSEARVLHLRVAYSPTQAQIADIGGWVKVTVGSDVVVEFEVDPSLVGGAIINFAGRYKDLTLLNQLEAELETV